MSTSFLHHIYDDSGIKLTLAKLLKGPTSDIWSRALSNELGRLTQGNNFGIKFTDCIQFISHHEVPPKRKATYAIFVCDHRPFKTEPWRVRLVVGGDKVEYLHDAGSPSTTILETKILIHSTISDSHKGARFLTLDIHNFFLCSTMPTPEYMLIHCRYISQEIIQ